MNLEKSVAIGIGKGRLSLSGESDSESEGGFPLSVCVAKERRASSDRKSVKTARCRYFTHSGYAALHKLVCGTGVIRRRPTA